MSAYILQRLKGAWDLFRQGKLAEAEQIVIKLLKSQPDHCDANNLMAGIQLYMNHVARAVVHAQRAVGSSPTNVAARQTLVSVLTAAGERREALRQIGTLLEMGAGDAELAITHAGTLRDLWRYDESVKLYDEAIRTYPANQLLPCLLPFTMQYAPHATREGIFAAHAAFGNSLDRRIPPVSRKHRNSADPERTLRIGIMSADLCAHSVMFFFASILDHADPAKMRFTAYQTHNLVSDAMTARLRSRFSGWREIMNDPPGRAAERVLADEIDVLVELNGLTTTLKALEVMNHAPAPVTVTYCGYPDTTGVRSVQYRIVDSITDPPGAEAFAVEELVRLDPCFLCYTPLSGAPPENPEPPCVRNGFVTFGSFNNIQKMHPGIAEAWSRLVLAVPGSKLLLKDSRLREPSRRQELQEMFERAGLARERLEFLERTEDSVEHLRLYDGLDVALDPFPYNGTTTICEATHQGVPTVTLRGDRHAARVGASLLTAIGEPGLIADDVPSYIALAAGLGKDPARLAAYRAGLRRRLLASPLCDGPGFARRFEDAIRVMWRRWCATRRD